MLEISEVGYYDVMGASMHTWDDIPVRRGVDKHTAGRLPVRDQVHVGVLVVVERVGCCWWRGLGRRYKIVLVIQRQRHIGWSGFVVTPPSSVCTVVVASV